MAQNSAQDAKLVSDSFMADIMIDDTEVSEGYDSDCYFQDLTKPHALTGLDPDENQGEQPDQHEEEDHTAKLRLQDSAMFEVILEDQGSFATFFNYEDTVDNPLERDIQTYAQNCRALGNLVNGYPDYFNYSLDVNNWRKFVNKQIYMKFERLFIEKQVNEVSQKKKQLEQQLSKLDEEIRDIKQQQEMVKNR